MSQPGPSTTRRSLPRGLLGMLALIAAIEAAVEAHHLDFTRFYIHDWRFTGRAASEATAGCRVLCLGDSLVKFGVDPRVIADRRGGEAYNLAVCDGQAASSYFLLRRALAAGARPEAVVVDFAPHLLAVDPRHNLRQWPELLTAAEAADLGWHTSHAGFFAAMTLGAVLPTVKDRHEIRASIVAALRGRPASRRGEIPGYVDQWRRDRGAHLSAARPGYDGSIDAGNPAYFPRRWRCHPTNDRYIRRLLDLAAGHGIRVSWLLPPVAPRFQGRRDELGLEASYDRLVRTLMDEHANLSVIDARHAGYGHGLFIDPLHLDRRGAERLSRDVAASLRRLRTGTSTGDRWVVLDGDVGASPRLALRGPDEGRRP